MAKKKPGQFSSSMITRGKKSPEIGFILASTHVPPLPPEKADQEEQKPSSPASIKAINTGLKPGQEAENRRGAGAQVVSFQARRDLLSNIADDDDDELQAARDQTAITAQALVQALRAADLEKAENLFREMTSLSSVEALRVLYAPGGEDLALACRALGLEQLQFVSIFIMTRKLGLGEEALDPKSLARIVALFESTDPGEASNTLSAWQH